MSYTIPQAAAATGYAEALERGRAASERMHFAGAQAAEKLFAICERYKENQNAKR